MWKIEPNKNISVVIQTHTELSKSRTVRGTREEGKKKRMIVKHITSV
jgi:hypothetical protein